MKIAANRVLTAFFALCVFLGLFIFPIPLVCVLGLLWAILEVRFWFHLYHLSVYLLQVPVTDRAAGADGAA